MQQKSMRALISAYSRVYHCKNNEVVIFEDSFGDQIISDDEYNQISKEMTKGINFMNPNFSGNDQEALQWVVNNQLCPTTLGRAVYTERLLKNAVRVGAKQYLIFAAGYDTFAYRQPDYAKQIEIFEIDKDFMSREKQERLSRVLKSDIENVSYIEADFTKNNWESCISTHHKFNSSKLSFCSLLGISYYLSKKDFMSTLSKIASIVPKGSSLVFDYQDEFAFTELACPRTKRQVMMAKACGEEMLGSYSYKELEEILSKCGFLIYEHLRPGDINQTYFKEYNQANSDAMITAFENVNYCLAVKNS